MGLPGFLVVLHIRDQHLSSHLALSLLKIGSMLLGESLAGGVCQGWLAGGIIAAGGSKEHTCPCSSAPEGMGGWRETFPRSRVFQPQP